MTASTTHSTCLAHDARGRIAVLTISLLLLSPCDEAKATARSDDRPCSAIADRSDRLDCFDGKSVRPHLISAALDRTHVIHPTAEDIIPIVRGQEAKRKRGQEGFLLTDDPVGGVRAISPVVASTPSRSPSQPGSFLVLSCVSNISRIQITSGQPIARPRTAVTLMQGETTHGSTAEWRVLGGGRVIDGGRGIPAIERIRSLREGDRLYVGSSSPVLDGLLFDMAGVEQVIERLREACHW